MSNSERAIERLYRIYGNPRTEDVPGFVGEYEKALNAFTPETLDRAINIVVQDFKPYANQPWPAISDLIKAARKTCEGTTDGKGEMDKIRARVRDAQRDAKVRAAWWLERSQLGKQALMEGWPRELWEWVSQIYTTAILEGRNVDPERIRFDPDRIAYAREYCKSGLMILVDLMVIFGSREKALEVYQAVYGEEWTQPDPAPPQKPQGNVIDWKRATAKPFRAMQATSPNTGLHREGGGVSDLSKRITGEHTE